MEVVGLVLLFAILAVLAFVGLAAYLRTQNSLRSAWYLAATELGLKFDEDSELEMLIQGSVGGYGLRLARKKRGRTFSTELALRNLAMPSGLTLKSEGGWQSLRKVALGEDILTGDEAFDAAINVTKDEATALAVLDATARARVVAFVRGWEGSEAAIEDGWLTWRRDGTLDKKDSITLLVREAVATAHVLQLDRSQIRHRLAVNAGEDPNAGVRRRNLELLGRVAPGSEMWTTALRVALADADQNVRALAATNLGADDLPRLLDLAVADPAASVRVKVMSHLSGFAGSALWPVIERGLRSKNAELQRAAILAAGATGHAALAPSIASHGASSDASIAEAVARALGQLVHREAEAVVVKLLEHEANEVRVAAAQALGALGTVAAVEPLLAQTSGVLKDATLKRAAVQAISSIQSRLGPVEMGRLSLLEPVPLAGALSTVGEGAAEGALSAVAEEAGSDSEKPVRLER